MECGTVEPQNRRGQNCRSDKGEVTWSKIIDFILNYERLKAEQYGVGTIDPRNFEPWKAEPWKVELWSRRTVESRTAEVRNEKWYGSGFLNSHSSFFDSVLREQIKRTSF
ncbi:MAG: hypothetical protein ACQERC_03735 [Bacteroidota bacterium]